MAKAKKGGAGLTVSLSPSVARDVITVLRKFSEQKMERMLPGQKDHADRLLDINLFRADIEEALREHDGK